MSSRVGLSKKQAQIFRFPNSPYKALICDGAVRSGKTIIMTIAFIDDAMSRFSGQMFGICGKTVGSAVKNIILPYLSSGVGEYLGYTLHWKKTDKILTVSRGRVTNRFEIFGGKDDSSYALIQGRTFAGVFLDEVALMPRSFVEQALVRCSVDGSKYWFNCNPAGQMHWFYQEWILQLEKHNAVHLRFLLDDNPSLSEEVKQSYHENFQGVFYDRYVKGLWVAADGIIYDMFDRNRHVVHDVPETEGKYYVSVDYGMQNATVYLLWRKVKDARKWVCLSEWYYSGRENRKQKTVKELADSFKDWLGDIKPCWTFVDPSAAALIEELRRMGYTVRQARNDVLDGISDVATMLGNDELLFADNCIRTIAEFGMYVWDEKRGQHGEDAPVKLNDHCMDAVRYFVNSMQLVKLMKM